MNAPSARLRFRLAAMVYESILLFAVLFVVTFAVVAPLGWKHPLPAAQRGTLVAVWIVALGLYFVWQWVRGGRTLAMKTWHLRVVRADGAALRPGQAVARYVLSWSLFLPGVVVVVLAAPPTALSLALLAASPLVVLATALLDRDRQLPHDRLLGARVVMDAPPPDR